MNSPLTAVNERERLKNVAEYSIMDSMPEREYNEITKLASFICGTPMSQLNIISDKIQFTKSNFGIPGVYTPRNLTVCNRALETPDEIFIVPDLRKDERFNDLPAVTGDIALVFYAGVPLVSPDGYALGTLCVLDNKPCELSTYQLETMKALANQVIALLELRRNKRVLEAANLKLEEQNKELEQFAYVVAHDLKSPLNSLNALAKYVSKQHGKELRPEVQEMLSIMSDSSEKLKRLVDGILDHSRSDKQLADANAGLDMAPFINEVVNLFSYYTDAKFTVAPINSSISTNKTALSQILINLISNAIKYNDKKEVQIAIHFTETDNDFTISVSDNGPGIEPKNRAEIFGIFKTCAQKDRFGQQGTGIGLATVKKIVERLQGEITLESEIYKGSAFRIKLPK